MPEVVGRSSLVKVIGHVLFANKDWQHPVGEVELKMLGYAHGLRIRETGTSFNAAARFTFATVIPPWPGDNDVEMTR